MSTQSKKSEEVVKQFAEGLSTLDLSKIAPILAPEFKFCYRLSHVLSGHGITTDVRYIGHLYRTFTAMKAEGITEIKTGFCELEFEGAKFLSIKLSPPHDRRILFPMEEQIISCLPRQKKGFCTKLNATMDLTSSLSIAGVKC